MKDPNDILDFLNYITKISKKFKHSKLSVSIYNCRNKLEYILSDNAKHKNNKYSIVFTDNCPVTPSNMNPDTYYCNTIQELEQILNFILKNQKLYTDNTYKYDALDNVYTESLDYYIDNELDDASTCDTYDL